MRLMLNPGSDRGIMVLKTYGYDLRELIINAIRNVNGSGVHNPIVGDDTFIARLPMVRDRISITVPDSELTGKVAEYLSSVSENERTTMLKEMVRYILAKDIVFKSGGTEPVPISPAKISPRKDEKPSETITQKKEQTNLFGWDFFDDDDSPDFLGLSSGKGNNI